MSDGEQTYLKGNNEESTSLFDKEATELKPHKVEAKEKAVSLDWKPGDVVLDLYEVKKELGKGGFGKVFQVYHKNWKTDLAVKIPKAESYTNKTARENFVREAQTWVDLGLYPNIVSCFYVRILGDAPCVFVEYVEGGSLSERIKERGCGAKTENLT